MLPKVHIANTNVEFEMARPTLEPLEMSLSRHSLCLQLQFLPLLYAQPEEIIAVTALPHQDYLINLEQSGWLPPRLPQLALLKDEKPFQGKSCQSWGPSQQVKAWAESRQMEYACPKWQVAQLVNSKAFSFRYHCLAEAALLSNEQELKNWMQQIQGPKVLKSCFGLSGQGNWRVDETIPSPELLTFCAKEWQQKRLVLGEPWLDRVYDFSTQWFIHPNQEIEWLGATRFETDANGIYQGTLAGPVTILFDTLKPFLEQHREAVQKALKDMAALGFFGFVGLDALIYRPFHQQPLRLYPLVEINGRQTMSLVALRLQQQKCPDQILRMSFQDHSSHQFSLLPSQLTNAKGKLINFRKKLTVTIL